MALHRRIGALAADARVGGGGVGGVIEGASPSPSRPVRSVHRQDAAAAVERRLVPGRRAVTYERELPVVLEALAGQLRSGSSVAQAIAAVTPSPSRCDLPRHWARLSRLVPVLGVEAALDDWADREGGSPSVRLAVGALTLAATTGGSAARAVDGVASTLRSRLAVSEEVRALSSQARLSAALITFAPVAFVAVAGVTDRRIVDFFTSPLGAVVLFVGLGLDAIGAVWMRRLCRVPA